MKSRRAFIESYGATCRNWRWSWAFVNHDARTVIFGAWDLTRLGDMAVILQDGWAINRSTGRRQPAYAEALDYIGLIRDQGYALKTFPMGHALVDPSVPEGTARIERFEPVLSDALLHRDGGRWLAVPFITYPGEESPTTGTVPLLEGGRFPVMVSAVERNARARAECLRLKGCRCMVCDLDFGESYGPDGTGFIHVHHIEPLAGSGGERSVDPATDLVPVCPNCHAMLHRRSPPFSLDEVRKMRLSAKVSA